MPLWIVVLAPAVATLAAGLLSRLLPGCCERDIRCPG